MGKARCHLPSAEGVGRDRRPVGRHGVDELLRVVTDPSDERLPEVARTCVAALVDKV